MFEVGEHVICVQEEVPGCCRESLKHFYNPCGSPVKDSQYVVSDIMGCVYHGQIVPGVRIVGLPVFFRADEVSLIETAWHPEMFRKLSDMRTEARSRRKQDQPVEV